MKRLVIVLFLLLLGSGNVFAQAVPPPGCTTTTCTGAALPTGYLSVVGNQLQNSPGSNVRPACMVYRGTETASMVPIRNSGANCIEIGWRDSAYTAGTLVTPNFSDDFTSAPWDTHATWQSGDKWGYGTSWAQAGLSEGPSWWGNAVVTPTAGTGGGGGGPILTDGQNLSQSYLNNLAQAVHNEQEAEVPGGECFTGTCIMQDYLQGDTILPLVAGQALTGDIGSLTDKDGNIWTLEGSPPCAGGPNWWFGGIKRNGTELFCGYEIAIRLLDNGQVYVEEAKGGGWWSLTQYCEAGCTGSSRPGEGGDPGPGPNNRAGGGTTNPALVAQSGSLLNLALIANPGGLSGVGTCNGGTCATIGTIIQDQQLPGGNNQLFGYYEFSVAVQSVPGFAFHWDVEDYPINNAWTMEIDADIWTGSDGSQHIRFVDPIHSNTIYETTAIDITQQNIIGVNWQSDFLTFYINNVQVAQAANPGGDFLTKAGFVYLLTTDASYFAGLPSPSAATLPAIASIDYHKVYTSKPSGVTPAPGCNSASQIASCVVNARTSGLGVFFTHLGNEVPAAGSACVGRQQNGLWFDSGGSSGNDDGCGDGHNWTYAGFKANSIALLKQFNGNPAVLGYEFHNEPLVNGTFTGQGGTLTGTSFTVNTAGQMIGPDGKVYRSYGINVDDTTLATAQVTDIQRLLPKMNTIRLAVGAATCGSGGYVCGQPISTLESWMRTIIAKNIVVMIESHACNGENIQASAIDLPGEYNWYNTIANDFKADPKAAYVWFESGNECGAQGQTRENRNVYNAVRGCPQAALTCDWLPSTGYSSGSVVYSKANIYTAASNCTSGGTAPTGTSNTSDGGCSWNFTKTGNPTVVAFEVSIFACCGRPDGPASQYTTMSNVIWTPHVYNGNTGGDTNQTNVNNDFANWVIADGNYTTSIGGGKIPSLFSEVGFIDYAGVCGGPDGAFNNPNYNTFACGGGQVVTSALTPTTTLELGTTIWTWHFDSCCEWQTDIVDRTTNPIQLYPLYGPIVANLIATNSPGQAVGTGGGTGGNPPINWGGGGDTDIRAACSDVGAAVYAVNPNVVQFCPGPLNNGTTLLNGGVKP